MKHVNMKTVFTGIILAFLSGCDSNAQMSPEKIKVKVILGTTRSKRSSDKIADALDQFLAKRTDIRIERIDLRDYNLPFLQDEVAPAVRKVITDPIIQRWSDVVADADAFIIITPEYNRGYPGVLKNALDLLYTEWGGKLVGFVGYSGGPSGGSVAIEQLRIVVTELKMVPVEAQITIPTVWKAFGADGALIDTSIESSLNHIIDELIAARVKKSA